jgi:hypothetical protein
MLKPHHEHPLLQNYSAYQVRAPWWCGYCKAEIVGPPWVIGEYIVTSKWKVRALSALVRGKWYDRGGRVWRVYMRSQFDSPSRVPLFESTRKVEAIKHARYLDRERLKIEALIRGEFSTPDEKLRAIAENYKEVMRLQRAERDS